jgi:hypothetical protein
MIVIRRNADRFWLRSRWRRPGLLGAQVGSSADAGLATRRLAALEAGCDHCYPNLITERVVDHRAENDVRVLVRSFLDEIRGRRDLEQTKI